jgi:arylsulfatase A-like enzyme
VSEAPERAPSGPSWLPSLRLGLLIGLVEAVAIVRYDVVMDDPRPARLAAALGPALLVVAFNGAFFALLGLVTRGRTLLVAALYLLLVGGVRAWARDRYEHLAVLVVPLALVAALVAARRPRLAGVAAALCAFPGLWGRVPVYATPALERALFLLPGALLATLAGALLPTGARRGDGVRLARALALVALLAWLVPQGLRLVVSEAASAGGTPDARPNVLFVLVDTLRRDAVSPYATASPPTEPFARHAAERGERPVPAIARLAAEGLRFDQAFTVVPKTAQSVAAFLTGRYPIRNGVRRLDDRLAAREETLAEVFGAAGYRTAAFVHNAWLLRGRGFEQGFDQFWSFHEIERAYGPLRLSGLAAALEYVVWQRIRKFYGRTDARTATDRALEWLAANADGERPFFLYAHYFDPHWPYAPPGMDDRCAVNYVQDTRWTRGQMIFANPFQAEENARALELYRGEITYNGEQVGRLLDWLDDAGLAEDTLVVFTADHGHHLGDHDYWYHHGAFLYEPGLAIPLILRWPGRIEAGATSSVPFRSVDLFPTLLDLAGLAPPGGSEGIDGLPLRVLAQEGAPPALLETDVCSFAANRRRPLEGIVGKVRGLRDGRWKLHLTPDRAGGRWELYDLATDPGETRDLVADGTAGEDLQLRLVAVLGAALPADERQGLEALGIRFDAVPGSYAVTPSAAPSVEEERVLDPNDAEALRALGYAE